MGGEGQAADYAVTYLRIAAIGFPAAFLALGAQGYLRGVADLRTPLVVLIADDSASRSPVSGSGAAETNARDVEQRMQKVAQATLSTNGQYLRLPIGHEIHLYRLAWVIEAVRQVVEASRIQTAH
jgi:hypothetical protein